MERVIGFRVEPTAFHWAVLEGTPESPVLVASDRERAPLHLTDAATLGWYRASAARLIDEYAPARAAIHPVDAVGKWAKRDVEKKRARIEDVLVSASHSKMLRTLIGRSIPVNANEPSLRGLDWSAVPLIRREAILAATAALVEGASK